MSESNVGPKSEYWAALVPELLVTDLSKSLSFYQDACGFRVRYARAEDGFAYLEIGQAQVMLEQVSEESWISGNLEAPLGRGINLQIEVPDVAATERLLLACGANMFRPMMTEWYREGDIEHGQAQFLVQDPDGYLLRFMQHLGERPVNPLAAG